MFELDRGNCPMRADNGNCLPVGGFCTAVSDIYCKIAHRSYGHGYTDNALSRRPRVLTYDEMKTMIGKPVYVEEPKRNADPQCYWGIVVEGEEPPKEGGYNYPGGVDFNVEVGLNIYDGDLYMVDIGCGWRAWTAEPTDDQRMNTPWDERSIKPDCPYVTDGKCIGKNACDLEERCVFKKDGEHDCQSIDWGAEDRDITVIGVVKAKDGELE